MWVGPAHTNTKNAASTITPYHPKHDRHFPHKNCCNQIVGHQHPFIYRPLSHHPYTVTLLQQSNWHPICYNSRITMSRPIDGFKKTERTHEENQERYVVNYTPFPKQLLTLSLLERISPPPDEVIEVSKQD